MSQVEPAFGRLDGGGSLSVLGFLDGMVDAAIDDDFFDDLRVHDIRGESPGNASSRAGLDEGILRAGVEGVLSVDEFRVQYYVSLLFRLRLEIRESLP